MKKLSLIILLVALAIHAFAQEAWTVETVPNTRWQSDNIHVSDPDGYLSDSAETVINATLCSICDTADVFVVTLSSIGDDDPKHFATSLFNYWGIGDAGIDNGVLLLFVEDQHALEFETGYGAEEVMTDARCERIFTQTILPHFREGDYEGGLCAGVADIVTVYGREIPDGLMNFIPVVASNDSSGDASGDDDFGPLMALVVLMIIILPVVGLVYWAKKRNEHSIATETCKLTVEDGINYFESVTNSWSGSPWEGKGCIGALMIGFSLFVSFVFTYAFMTARFPNMPAKNQSEWAAFSALVLYFTWMCFRQGRRTLQTAESLAKRSVNPASVYQAALNHKANKLAFWMAPWLGWVFVRKLKSRLANSSECLCPTCRGKMHKDTRFKLSEIHNLENRLGSMRYRPFKCANGHAIVLKEKGKNYSQFSTCSMCGAFAMKKIHTMTLRQADYSHSGEKEETYECQNCGHTFTKRVVIPKKISYTSSDSGYYSSSSSRSYSSSSSRSSSGGSFGGGRSGGGGYSGRW